MDGAQSRPVVAELSGVTLGAPNPRRRADITGLDWQIREGDFWVVTTTQHAGLRELLFTAAGLQRPLAGKVSLFGRDTSHPDPRRWSEQQARAGVVFEQGGLVLGEMTVAENVSLPLRYHRNCRFEEVEAGTVQVLEATGLLPFAAASPRELSGDWQQRVALARALAARPQLLFFERPLAHLEWPHRQWWLSFIPRLASGRGVPGLVPVTVVVLTDDARSWEGAARQFAVLRRQEWRVLEGVPDLDPAGWIESPTGC
jgi:ABC-type transporter Mla maintaining outer membrane lipid asymmetry ATPase subunit MlaF